MADMTGWVKTYSGDGYINPTTLETISGAEYNNRSIGTGFGDGSNNVYIDSPAVSATALGDVTGMATIGTDPGLIGATYGDVYKNDAGSYMQSGFGLDTDISGKSMAAYDTWAGQNPDQAAAIGNGVNFDKDGVNTLNVPDTDSSGFGLNTDTLGKVAAVGQLGLGYLNYKDSHAMNKQNLAGAKFNLAEAKNESRINAAYRKSYGLV